MSAGSTEAAAERSFWVGGNAGAIHRNDINAAGGSAAAAAVFAAIFRG